MGELVFRVKGRPPLKKLLQFLSVSFKIRQPVNSQYISAFYNTELNELLATGLIAVNQLSEGKNKLFIKILPVDKDTPLLSKSIWPVRNTIRSQPEIATFLKQFIQTRFNQTINGTIKLVFKTSTKSQSWLLSVGKTKGIMFLEETKLLPGSIKNRISRRTICFSYKEQSDNAEFSVLKQIPGKFPNLTLTRGDRLNEILGQANMKAGFSQPSYKPPDDFASLFVYTVNYYLNHVLGQIPGIKTGIDPEYLHKFRVSLRKLRSFLMSVRYTFPRGLLTEIIVNFRQVGRKMSPLRDIDVFISDFSKYLDPQPGNNTDEELLFFIRELRRKRSQCKYRLMNYIKKEDLEGKIKGMLAEPESFIVRIKKIKEPAAEPAKNVLIPSLISYLNEIENLYIRIFEQEKTLHDYMIHRLRIRFKRLRYLLDVLKSLQQEGQKTNTSILPDIQDLLGDYVDGIYASATTLKIAENLKRKNANPAELNTCYTLYYNINSHKESLVPLIKKQVGAYLHSEEWNDLRALGV